MNQDFAIRNAATRRVVTKKEVTDEEREWVAPGRTPDYAHLVQDYPYAVVPTVAALESVFASSKPSEQRSRTYVVDSSGHVRKFTTGSVSLSLAQPFDNTTVPEVVFFTANNDLEEENILYVVSDNFSEFYGALNELEKPYTVTDQGPNNIALGKAHHVLDYARTEGVVPTRILSGSHGVFIYFSSGEKYAEVECDNDGDVAVTMSDRTVEPVVWFTDIQRLPSDMARIRAFLV